MTEQEFATKEEAVINAVDAISDMVRKAAAAILCPACQGDNCAEVCKDCTELRQKLVNSLWWEGIEVEPDRLFGYDSGVEHPADDAWKPEDEEEPEQPEQPAQPAQPEA